jgi:hypothetical protein
MLDARCVRTVWRARARCPESPFQHPIGLFRARQLKNGFSLRTAAPLTLILVAALTLGCTSSADQPSSGRSGDSSTAASPSQAESAPAKQEINKTITVKQSDGSADVTLVSLTQSKGSKDALLPPESGNYVVVELKVAGKTGSYHFNSLYVQLKKPDGKLIDELEGNGNYAVPTSESIDPADIAPGVTASGKIGFDLVLEPGSKLVITDQLENPTAEWPL